MERQLISHLAHADHPIAAPVSEESLERLLVRAKPPARARILDLGCGSAAWLVRALSLYPDATADGVDISDTGFAEAVEEAGRRGVADRLRLHHGPAADFAADEPYDLVLCVGATHAFGGFAPALDAVRGHLRPAGLALVGEGFWERPPTPELLALLDAEPGEYADLAGTAERAEGAGYATVHAHTSTLGEWDEYEWSWTGSLTRWALDHPGPDGEAALSAAREHRDMWLKGYRGVLGFVTLLLRRA
ncbi:3-demethylubiquinone-9 3-methyltransferase [[Actinomadura] parvosata subsp. kistnae]|uniref:SAM-dependent methyltransferase n=1 Tax=[Actinomadura] parvosata subsp. kistnae TaxID=1909395 RepID=A0A1V0A137_9ACTN|nr:class I SAM-dependent methyltransferase [Nonomuraea sp. ATCC 55076]AQZ63882.1 SAM-dependent methyltransferase [Nonomuraea sp. ATCC 55076]SPL89722.1 3-demethylubiquinone-9 3-methyltransferase [Actinomadura parvosata subsp. kistnae]